MKISRRKMLIRSACLTIGSLFIPISYATAVNGNRHLSKGLDLIHKVLSRPLDVSISHLNKCLSSGKIDLENHEGFKDYINSLITVFNGHHHGEDEILFPTFEEKIKGADFSKLKKQHKEIHPIAEKIKDKINVTDPSFDNYEEIRNLLQKMNDLWIEHRDEEEGIVELDMEPLISSKEQIELNDKLSKHGRDMSEPANLILPFLIYNLEGSDRDTFTDDMPWILKNFVVPIIWKSKWEKMKPFLLA
tara:strand:+ start:717 stop:1457 length:741 start_codon:yes stop_codon:yes gene_type:complete